jgi:hypothetical protein
MQHVFMNPIKFVLIISPMAEHPNFAKIAWPLDLWFIDWVDLPITSYLLVNTDGPTLPYRLDRGLGLKNWHYLVMSWIKPNNLYKKYFIRDCSLK